MPLFDPVLPFGLLPDVTDMLVGLVPPTPPPPPPTLAVPLLGTLVAMTWPGIVAAVAPMIPLQLVPLALWLVAMSVSPPPICVMRLLIVCLFRSAKPLVFCARAFTVRSARVFRCKRVCCFVRLPICWLTLIRTGPLGLFSRVSDYTVRAQLVSGAFMRLALAEQHLFIF